MAISNNDGGGQRQPPWWRRELDNLPHTTTPPHVALPTTSAMHSLLPHHTTHCTIPHVPLHPTHIHTLHTPATTPTPYTLPRLGHNTRTPVHTLRPRSGLPTTHTTCTTRMPHRLPFCNTRARLAFACSSAWHCISGHSQALDHAHTCRHPPFLPCCTHMVCTAWLPMTRRALTHLPHLLPLVPSSLFPQPVLISLLAHPASFGFTRRAAACCGLLASSPVA